VRPVDVEAAQAEVNRALVAVNQAKADLEEAFVKFQNGSVLDINTARIDWGQWHRRDWSNRSNVRCGRGLSVTLVE